MAVEREIKLSFPASAELPQQLAACLDAWSGSRPGETIHLINRYYDTADAQLAQARAALRLRYIERGRAGGQWLQTLKSSGQSANGLHTRHEWEMPVARGEFDLASLMAECDVPDMVALLRTHAASLEPLFETNFTRRLWHVTAHGAQLEVALDQGEVIVESRGMRHTAPLNEIEIELPDTASDAMSNTENVLRAFADALRLQFPLLQPDDTSKAARGYRLRQQALSQTS